MRIVLDANILLAAFGTHGLCEALFEVCLARHELYTSAGLLHEVHSHLSAKFKLPPERVREVMDILSAQLHLVQPIAVVNNACRDSSDLMVLGTAVAAQADCLVTGDKDLLVIEQFQGVAILSPRAFYDRLKLT